MIIPYAPSWIAIYNRNNCDRETFIVQATGETGKKPSASAPVSASAPAPAPAFVIKALDKWSTVLGQPIILSLTLPNDKHCNVFILSVKDAGKCFRETSVIALMPACSGSFLWHCCSSASFPSCPPASNHKSCSRGCRSSSSWPRTSFGRRCRVKTEAK